MRVYGDLLWCVSYSPVPGSGVVWYFPGKQVKSNGCDAGGARLLAAYGLREKPKSTLFSNLMRQRFAFRAKKPLRTGVRTGCHCLIGLPVCLSVCRNVRLCVCGCATTFFVVFTDCESCTRPISTNKPGIYGNGLVWANAWDVFSRTPSRVGRGRRAAVDFVVCFGWPRADFFVFFFFLFFDFFFSPNAHGLLRI